MSDFDKLFFSANRKNIVKKLPGHTLLITANAALQYSADQAFPFRQDSSFWYFTGVQVAEALLLVDCDSGKATILLPQQNDYQQEWDGVFNADDLKQISGVDEIIFKYDLNMIFKDIRRKEHKIGYLPASPDRVEPYGFYANPARAHLEKDLKKSKIELTDIRTEVGRLRSVKQSVEITEIEKAISTTGSALEDVKNRLASFKSEADIVRALSSRFYGAADGHGFDPIVASGKNASIIHYTDNASPIQKDGLLLLDIGAKSFMYSADISRTWAVGRPSQRQKDICGAVLELHNMAMNLVKPGALLKESQQKINQRMKQMAQRLKIEQTVMPHGVSHFLGIDVHDAGNYDAPLEPGMVVTVEPGIYLPDEGIGVRIEDDVLVTETGHRNLSKHIPVAL